MLFKVISTKPKKEKQSTLILSRDNWNDYSFKTLYQLYFAERDAAPSLIGDVKILKKGQLADMSHSLECGTFESLSEQFCSLGQSLDYYERLAAYPEDLRNFVLDGLRDIIKSPEIKENFKEEAGLDTSLFRSVPQDGELRTLASVLLTKDYRALMGLNLKFSYSAANIADSIEFSFNAPEFSDPNDLFDENTQSLPNRISVLIGRNGSGKSTILARLARLAFASTYHREEHLKELGELLPSGIGFSRVISISYSGFDSFEVPGVNSEERALISKEVNQGIGRFLFCGLRDIAAEMEQVLTQSARQRARLPERRRTTLLKNIDVIADEFVRTITMIRSKNRERLLVKALDLLFQEPSFQGMSTDVFLEFTEENLRDHFLQWSTGHKIALHAICYLIAHTEPRSLILFDEPESHLHPPLLAALMHAIRAVLDKKDAFAIVATHSPVILQESIAKHVHIIRREGDSLSISHPKTETFGENIGLLTAQVFNLTSNATDYHSTLKKLVDASATLEQIEDLFGGGLSMQARAYVMSLLALRGS